MMMRTFLSVCLLASLLVGSWAECPNACSGHGTCSTEEDYCECFRNWQGADCSQRSCPFGISWVDAPQGDLNFDGDVSDLVTYSATNQWSFDNWETNPVQKWSSVAAASYAPADAAKMLPDEGHFWTECSGKGICDRSVGECKCYDGYTGAACQRQSCPNDCSGHGVCRFVADVEDYSLWDAYMSRTCVCDRGYTGRDCKDRLCPKGDDPLDGAGDQEVQRIALTCDYHDWQATFRIKYTDEFGFSWETSNITVRDPSSDFDTTVDAESSTIQTALRALPNDVLNAATVAGTELSSPYGANFDITFGLVGDVDTIEVLDFTVSVPSTSFGDCNDMSPTITTTQAGTAADLTECSNRGLCDTSTGLCKCFRGYTGAACNTQNALAGSTSTSSSGGNF